MRTLLFSCAEVVADQRADSLDDAVGGQIRTRSFLSHMAEAGRRAERPPCTFYADVRRFYTDIPEKSPDFRDFFVSEK